MNKKIKKELILICKYRLVSDSEKEIKENDRKLLVNNIKVKIEINNKK